MLPGLRQFVTGLHAQKRIRLDPKSLLEADRHISRQSGIAVEQGADSLPGHPKVISKVLHADGGRFDNLCLEPITHMDR